MNTSQEQEGRAKLPYLTYNEIHKINWAFAFFQTSVFFSSQLCFFMMNFSPDQQISK